ncbi:hypothetical protein [Geoalkalibacter halelectricus]|uniref:Uncharacterized protein n=1 Tax=Geoalkalibacter halelectricus TaxID=2847045 RepID=A0ABY5ZKB7_9BACT|nr:hypothetical protein [Geoalkalibacter halelectricus]MDO3378934.1 hypothetical protein [Geoalkalibacter halelectricus]UWZ79043.1 hypothetical protein L9S41_15360 [Geoalkalibacter halelectricus]
MHAEERINVCQAVMHGNTRTVMNIKNSRKGRVLRFDDQGFEVEVGAARERWTFDEVRVETKLEN